MNRVPVFVSGERDGKIVCIGIFSLRPHFFGKRFSLDAYCLRGPAFDEVGVFRPFMERVTDYFKELGAGNLRISPYWTYPEGEEVESELAALDFVPYNRSEGRRSSTGYVDLTRTEEEMLASLSKKTRQKIRDAEQQGVEVGPVRSWTQARIFWEALDKMSMERGICRMPFGEFQATYESVLKNQDLGVLVTAFHGPVFLGGILVIRGQSLAHSPNIVVDRGGLDRFRNLTITPAVFWCGIRWAKAKGCQWFDVEGYAENTSLENRVYHIHESKGKFRPNPVQIIAEHIIVCNSVVNSIHSGQMFFQRGCRFIRSLPSRMARRSARRPIPRQEAPKDASV